MKAKKISAKRFYMEIMKEQNCSLVQIVEAVESLKEQGLVEVAEYDYEGTPISFWRLDQVPKHKIGGIKK